MMSSILLLAGFLGHHRRSKRVGEKQKHGLSHNVLVNKHTVLLLMYEVGNTAFVTPKVFEAQESSKYDPCMHSKRTNL